MFSVLNKLSSLLWDEQEARDYPIIPLGTTPPAQTFEELRTKMRRRGLGSESPATLLDWWKERRGVVLQGDASSIAERMLVMDVPGDGYCLLNAINVQLEEEDFIRPGELEEYMKRRSLSQSNPLYYIPNIWHNVLKEDLSSMDVRNFRTCMSLDMFWCILIADVLQRAIIVVSNNDDMSKNDPTRLHMDVFLPVLHEGLRKSPLYVLREGYHFMQLMLLDCERQNLPSDRLCTLERLRDDVRLRIYTKEGGPFPFHVSDPDNPLPLYFQILKERG